MVIPPQQLAFTVKSVAVVVAFGLIMYTFSPPSYWKLAKHTRVSPLCSSCLCDCLPESDSMLLPGYGNTASSDCASLQEDVDQRSIGLLAEELRLQENAAEESQRHADAALLEAKKVASQYQKEAEKCSSGMETCEEARERSEAALAAQKEISGIWEKRARQLGWRDKHVSLFDRIGFSSTGTNQQGNSFLFKRQARKH